MSQIDGKIGKIMKNGKIQKTENPKNGKIQKNRENTKNM